MIAQLSGHRYPREILTRPHLYRLIGDAGPSGDTTSVHCAILDAPLRDADGVALHDCVMRSRQSMAALCRRHEGTRRCRGSR